MTSSAFSMMLRTRWGSREQPRACSRLSTLWSRDRFGPGGPLSLKADGLVAERLCESQPPGVQAHRRVVDREGLLRAELLVRQIRRVAHDWVAEVPEVHADLIGAARAGRGLNEGLAI